MLPPLLLLLLLLLLLFPFLLFPVKELRAFLRLLATPVAASLAFLAISFPAPLLFAAFAAFPKPTAAAAFPRTFLAPFNALFTPAVTVFVAVSALGISATVGISTGAVVPALPQGDMDNK
ncbi:MAG: hypothetical protein EBU82_03240 [Flavobacteriia bacterium]|nr:hypothetical protein [Flavobacteriia bacterium]